MSLLVSWRCKDKLISMLRLRTRRNYSAESSRTSPYSLAGRCWQTPGSSSRQRRRHLDVGGGRKREMGVRERGKEEVPDSQESSCGHLQSLLDLAKSDVFKCFFVQKNFPQSLAVTKSEDCLREINKSFFPSLSVYSHPDL